MKDVMLIVHFIGVAMGVGTGLAFLFLGMGARKLENSEAARFAINTFSLSKMGQYGLVLLFLSGGYLMTPYWSSLSSMPLLMTKLVLFLVLGAFVGILSGKMRKTTMDNAASQLPKIKTFGRLTLLTGLVIIVLAVLVFH